MSDCIGSVKETYDVVKGYDREVCCSLFGISVEIGKTIDQSIRVH